MIWVKHPPMGQVIGIGYVTRAVKILLHNRDDLITFVATPEEGC